MSNYISILEEIFKINRCAHFVLANHERRPVKKYLGRPYRWSGTIVSTLSLADHIESGEVIGVIPSTVNSFVVDADYKKSDHAATDEDIKKTWNGCNSIPLSKV